MKSPLPSVQIRQWMLVLLAFGNVHFAVAQEPEDIIQQANKACSKVESGRYLMVHDTKYISGRDTVRNTYDCGFSRVRGKHPFPVLFQYRKSDSNGQLLQEVEYNGKELADANPMESTVTVMSRNKWDKEIEEIAHNFILFGPFSKKAGYVLDLPTGPKIAAFLDMKAEEKIGGRLCYHIHFEGKQDCSAGAGLQVIASQRDFWIDKESMLVMRYAIGYDLTMDGDTMRQYDDRRLERLDLGQGTEKVALDFRKPESGYEFRDYQPRAKLQMLETGSSAPDWKLPTLAGDSMSLADLNGKVVLVDFFYRTCAPCMHAMPVLQRLHEQYSDKGLVVIGIDPKNDSAEALTELLKTKAVTYPVLMAPEALAKSYNVDGYPTMYLIDRTGKVSSSHRGFGDGSEKELVKAIEKSLE